VLYIPPTQPQWLASHNNRISRPTLSIIIMSTNIIRRLDVTTYHHDTDSNITAIGIPVTDEDRFDEEIPNYYLGDGDYDEQDLNQGPSEDDEEYSDEEIPKDFPEDEDHHGKGNERHSNGAKPEYNERYECRHCGPKHSYFEFLDILDHFLSDHPEFCLFICADQCGKGVIADGFRRFSKPENLIGHLIRQHDMSRDEAEKCCDIAEAKAIKFMTTALPETVQCRFCTSEFATTYNLYEHCMDKRSVSIQRFSTRV
jgi:DNA-directed RNA polymerase subunit M/transcription elongation factor TFIIS